MEKSPSLYSVLSLRNRQTTSDTLSRGAQQGQARWNHSRPKWKVAYLGKGYRRDVHCAHVYVIRYICSLEMTVEFLELFAMSSSNLLQNSLTRELSAAFLSHISIWRDWSLV